MDLRVVAMTWCVVWSRVRKPCTVRDHGAANLVVLKQGKTGLSLSLLPRRVQNHHGCDVNADDESR